MEPHVHLHLRHPCSSLSAKTYWNLMNLISNNNILFLCFINVCCYGTMCSSFLWQLGLTLYGLNSIHYLIPINKYYNVLSLIYYSVCFFVFYLFFNLYLLYYKFLHFFLLLNLFTYLFFYLLCEFFSNSSSNTEGIHD